MSLTGARLLNIFTLLLRACAHKQRRSKQVSGPKREQIAEQKKSHNRDFYNLTTIKSTIVRFIDRTRSTRGVLVEEWTSLAGSKSRWDDTK